MSEPRIQVQPRIVALIRPGTAYPTAGIALALGVARGAARQALDRLTAKGLIARRKIGIDCMYFATQADADAWSQAEAVAFAREQAAKRAAALAASHRRLGQRVTKAAKLAARAAKAAEAEARRGAQPAPVVIAPRPRWADAQPDMSRAKVTKAPPAVDYRWHVDPASVQPGACRMADAGPRWSDYVLERRP